MFDQGYITIAKCTKCRETFPIFTFVADTDMVTIGCVSLTNKNKNIALTIQGPNETDEQVEARVGEGFKFVSVSYREKKVPPGLSFREYRKVYSPSVQVFECIYCGGESIELKQITKDKFLIAGEIKVHPAS